MGIEENKEVVRHYIELLNQRKPDAANELFSPELNMGGFTREDNRQHDTMVLNAFPDVEWTISNMIAEGDTVAFIDNVTGTHTGGPYLGIPPTSKKIDCKNTYIVRIVDNKVVEWRGTADFYNLMQQLEVIPSLPDAIKAYNESQE
jgi:predicted ester cyclase